MRNIRVLTILVQFLFQFVVRKYTYMHIKLYIKFSSNMKPLKIKFDYEFNLLSDGFLKRLDPYLPTCRGVLTPSASSDLLKC